MVEYIPCCIAPFEHWGLLPATRLASRKILIKQNIKKRTGPALCVLCHPSQMVHVAGCTTVKRTPVWGGGVEGGGVDNVSIKARIGRDTGQQNFTI
jgi:hypothetical protein